MALLALTATGLRVPVSASARARRNLIKTLPTYMPAAGWMEGAKQRAKSAISANSPRVRSVKAPGAACGMYRARIGGVPTA